MENVGCVEIAIDEKMLYGFFILFYCFVQFQQLFIYLLLLFMFLISLFIFIITCCSSKVLY